MLKPTKLEIRDSSSDLLICYFYVLMLKQKLNKNDLRGRKTCAISKPLYETYKIDEIIQSESD